MLRGDQNLRGKEMARVLVVDDEEAIRFTFQRFLTDAGHEVSVAEYENDAREILSANEFDVAVIDRILPDGNSGLDLMKEIKNLQLSCEVIMISGLPMFRDSSKAEEDEPFTYLTKPIRGSEIVQHVEEAVKESMLKEEVA